MNKRENFQDKKYTINPGYHWDDYKKNNYYKSIIDYACQIIPSNTKIIDIGCGDGVLSGLLANKKCNVTGIDRNKDAILFAKNKTLKSNFYCIGISEYLELNKQAYDWTIALDVIEHLENPSKLLQLMKIGNKKLIGTPEKSIEKSHQSHFKEYTVSELEYTVSKFFKILKIDKLELKKGSKIKNYLFLIGE